MSRHSLSTLSYVKKILSLDSHDRINADSTYIPYSYVQEREIFKDPCLPDKYVIVVNSTDEANETGQPNTVQESYNYIDNLKNAAKSLIKKDKKDEKDQRELAVERVVEFFKEEIRTKLINQNGNLFLSKKNNINKKFIQGAENAKKILIAFNQSIATISQQTLKSLAQEGHQIRSQNRDTLVHRFKGPNHEEQFIMYIPCARYTPRQQQLMHKKSRVDRDDNTTSHHCKGLVSPGKAGGIASFMRLVAGTYKDGKATILHDSLTGPGARMPYQDFKHADQYKKLAIKAVTLINQEEIIQVLAQRQIERMSNEELRDQIKANDPSINSKINSLNAEQERKALMELYLKDYPLNVTECYTQVITAGQKVSSPNQREQFEYVRQVMDAFSGADSVEMDVCIQTGEHSEIKAKVNYTARMCSWGVNRLRHVGRFNPLADNRIAANQNTRFFNQMTDDTVFYLGKVQKEISVKLKKSPVIKQTLDTVCKEFKLNSLLDDTRITDRNLDILKKEEDLKPDKAQYRQYLFDYYEAYNQVEPNQNQLDELMQKIALAERKIHTIENEIYKLHCEIEALRKIAYQRSKEKIKRVLTALRSAISQEAAYLGEQEREPLKKAYNVCAYLAESQALYYQDTWHKRKNKFKLQALVSCLGIELDYANTKGCKSNNDRGQRLAQKIIGNDLWTKTMDDGLFTGLFLNQKRTHCRDNVSVLEKFDRIFTTIQALFHTGNMGVSGGKFGIDKESFADNGLWGVIAKFAQIKNMKLNFIKSLKAKLAIGIKCSLAGAALLIGSGLLFPALGLGLAASMHIGFIAFGLSLAAAVGVSVIQHAGHLNSIHRLVQKSLAHAKRENKEHAKVGKAMTKNTSLPEIVLSTNASVKHSQDLTCNHQVNRQDDLENPLKVINKSPSFFTKKDSQSNEDQSPQDPGKVQYIK